MPSEDSSQPTRGYDHDPPFDSGYLRVSDLHSLYYEQYGNPNGKPGSTPLFFSLLFSNPIYYLRKLAPP